MLQQHIELAELVREIYRATLGKIQTTDHDTQLTNTGEGLR
ncbi:hypothetical protein [Nocardia paucivorans]|nr:hypothetical protein [Nocardia paucivorans]